MAKNRSVEKEEFWRLVLEEQSESGLTIKVYCEQQGVSAPSFYAWKRQIKLRDAAASNCGREVGQENRIIPVQLVNQQSSQSERFADSIQSGSAETIEIVSPAGFVFRFGTGVSPMHLSDVIAAVDQRGLRAC